MSNEFDKFMQFGIHFLNFFYDFNIQHYFFLKKNSSVVIFNFFSIDLS